MIAEMFVKCIQDCEKAITLEPGYLSSYEIKAMPEAKI